ncbi:MAG: prepilin-type N-terminal cleavage/methylation domain-containing protein [Planctomycetota bacterium]
MRAHPTTPARRAAGFTLVEILAALMILALALIPLMGLRMGSVETSVEARNKRIAAGIAQQVLSEIQAGLHRAWELRHERHPFEGFNGFTWEVLIGETEIQNVLSAHAEEEANVQDSDDAYRRLERWQWLEDRMNRKRASRLGVDVDQAEDMETEVDDTPDEDTVEEVAVMVSYFSPLRRDGQGLFLLRGEATTLALSGLTSEQAKELSKGAEDGGQD